MTSSGQLKRPLDYEFPQHVNGPSGNEQSQINGSNVANRNKRKCLNFAQSRLDPISGHHDGSPFKDSSSFLKPLAEEIDSVIHDEIQDLNQCNGIDTPILSKRQTRSICERLIKDREQKIRDEYNRILTCKIAEQYDLIAKANYMNSYMEPRMPTALTPPPPGNPSISALAAAFTSMQRSVASAASASASLSDLNSFSTQLSANNQPGALTPSHLAYNLQQQAAVAAAAAVQAHQQRIPGNPNSIPSGPVLLVSNLDEQLATPEALFTLFGVFGDVVRVKILFNKKDNSLIQMADAHQAQVAMMNLDKQKIFGKIIRVAKSKHQIVQMPREGNQSDAGLTKDFTNSPLHRFKIPGSRNYLNIYPPSNTLHISNIPATIEESDLHKAFKTECGFEYSSFKFFPKDRKMALMKFNSVEQATIALIKMHNFQISGDTNLRVSFSKSVMQQ